jgi:hypothetical protein
MSETAITLAGTTVGMWNRDCATLRSRVVLREHKLHFRFALAVASPVATIIEALPGIGTVLGPKVKRLAGEFKGSLSIDVEAEPTRRTCVGGKQYVGYDIVLVMKGTTTATIGGNSVDIEATVPIAIQGEEEPCDCNPRLDPFAVSMSKLEMQTLVAVPEGKGEYYALAGTTWMDGLEPRAADNMALGSVSAEATHPGGAGSC